MSGDDALGTTKRGIGPAYSDKAARVGIRAGDLLEPDTLPGRLSAAIESKRAVLDSYKVEPLSLEKLTQAAKVYAERLGPMIRPTEPMVNDALDSGKTVVFEGAQGALLDLDFGTYPYVTSSPTTALGVYAGAFYAQEPLKEQWFSHLSPSAKGKTLCRGGKVLKWPFCRDRQSSESYSLPLRTSKISA